MHCGLCSPPPSQAHRRCHCTHVYCVDLDASASLTRMCSVSLIIRPHIPHGAALASSWDIHPLILYISKLSKMSKHHLDSLYMHSSWSPRIALIAALTADTSALLLVCDPTAGRVTLGHSPCGKYTPYPACLRTCDPSTQACTFTSSSKKSGTDSAS